MFGGVNMKKIVAILTVLMVIITQDSENSKVGDLVVEKIDDNYTLNEYAHSSAIGAALKQAILEIENLKQEIEKLKVTKQNIRK